MTKKRILIIDDDSVLNEEMVEMFEADGYTVDSATDGPGGISLIRKNDYDVFLLDFKLENITGLELLREVREKDKGTPVFLISGKPGLEALLERENLADAVRAIIEKPFDPELLLKKIAAC